MKSARILIGLLVLLAAYPALAAGPLIIFDPSTQQAFFYNVPLNVYTDNDPLFSFRGPVSNASADTRVAEGIAEWTNVATSTFSGSVAGDFASIGLPDINLSNVNSVIGTFNGGGYHVIYDSNGAITSAVAGPGVLGFSSPEWATTGTPFLTESYAVLNGASVSVGDTDALAWAGVFTHEFGHGINLAHAQANGAVGFFGDDAGPAGCPPFPGLPPISTLETMFPFIDPRPGGSGPAQATVDLLEDISSISNIYPAAGWPANFGTIDGTILLSNGLSPVTGVNVIARNVADPWGDCASMLSGASTQGLLGPDGRYVFNGLTPGADYVVYVDAIVAGGFSTPPRRPLPGPEEFWNGANESGDPDLDAVCDFTPITAVAGNPFTADVIFNFGIFLGDDDFQAVFLPFLFEFCGQTWDRVFVGSNGFVTFGLGDTDFSPSVGDLVSGPPRIAPLWIDLNPPQGGSITTDEGAGFWKVIYKDIPEFFNAGANSFSITLRTDNTFSIDYGAMTAGNGLAGRTEGGGVPDPGETDLSAEPQPIGVGVGTVYEFFTSFDFDLANSILDYGLCDPFVFTFDPGLPGTCYASTGAGGTNGALLTIDDATGAGTLIGQTGLQRLPAIAVNSNRDIWGSSGGGASQLVRVSASDALTQVVAPIRNRQNAATLPFVDALAFDSNDVLYAIDASNRLWTVDTADGFADEIGFTGVVGAPFLVGMAFDPTTGRLYASTGGLGGADEIYEIDRLSGLATLLGNTGLGSRAIPDLKFQDNGSFFGVKNAGGGVFNLISIDKTTGAGSVVGNVGYRSVSGLAWSRHDVVDAILMIKPGGCPNPLNIKLFDPLRGQPNGVFPTAIAGTPEFDVTQIDVSTITLAGISPQSVDVEDGVRIPGEPDEGRGVSLCPCPPDAENDDQPDGNLDLMIKFRQKDLVEGIAPGKAGEERLLTMSGFFVDGRPFEGVDCIVFVGGRGGGEDGGGDGDVPMPPVEEPELEEAYPNPFNPVTRINYAIPRTTLVTLSVYDVKGRLVTRLVSGTRTAGRHVVEWDASAQASGIYFYRLVAGNYIETKKMILLK